jgi:oxalate decarboxylase/phosphoglucose isomerase-like protein (cupin superfamily)
MKIQKLVFLAASAMILLLSCVTTPHNLGIHNPDNIPDEDMVTLYVFPHIEVMRIDDYRVNWSEEYHKNQTVIIPSGCIHSVKNIMMAVFTPCFQCR